MSHEILDLQVEERIRLARLESSRVIKGPASQAAIEKINARYGLSQGPDRERYEQFLKQNDQISTREFVIFCGLRMQNAILSTILSLLAGGRK